LKVVFDTNVYVSEALFNALAEAVLKAGRNGAFSIYISNFILAEIHRVLVSRFRTTRRFASLTVRRALRFSRLVPTSQRKYQELADPHDHPVLETAVNSGADYLVTGDKHLLVLSSYHGINIVRELGAFTVYSGTPARREAQEYSETVLTGEFGDEDMAAT
jgi:uncharacterized protein